MKHGENGEANWTAGELSVLRSAEEDVPRAGSLKRTLTALGGGSGLGAEPGPAPLANPLGPLARLGPRWLRATVAGAVLALGGLAALVIATRGRARVAASIAVPASVARVSRPEPAAPARASAPFAAPPPAEIAAAPLPAAATRPSVSAPARDTRGPNDDTLAEEIRLIDEARIRLHRGDPKGALETIARYDQLVKRGGRMRAEATVVRIESLQASGDTARAAKLGQRFLADNPKSPYAGYVQRVLSRPE